MKIENISYLCFEREMFSNLTFSLVSHMLNYNNYMISIPNKKIRDLFITSEINYNLLEHLIVNIAQELFEKGKYTMYIDTIKDEKDNIKKIEFLSEKKKEIEDKETIYKVKLKNDFRVLSWIKRKKLLYMFSKMNALKIKGCDSTEELIYNILKDEQKKYSLLKYTKDIYFPMNDSDNLTTYYQNYRIIKMKSWQVKYVESILEQLNTYLEKIFKEKDIIKYNGISLKELKKYSDKLKENEISMSEIYNKLMKVDKI